MMRGELNQIRRKIWLARARGVQFQQLAKEVGCSRAWISIFLKGKNPSVDHPYIKGILRALEKK